MKGNSANELAFLERLTRYDADELSGAEVEALEKELLADSGKRKMLVRHFEEGQQLRKLLQQPERSPGIIPFDSGASLAETRKNSRMGPVLAAAAAVVGLLAVAWVLIASNRGNSDGSAVAGASSASPGGESLIPPVAAPRDTLPRLAFTKNAIWRSTPPGEIGSTMAAGRWRLKSGKITIRFPDGAEATIQGPASFDLTEKQLIRLKQGRLAAKNQGSRRLTVVANGRRIVNRDNSFGVTAGRDLGAQVYAFGGEVAIQGLSRPPVRVMGGFSAVLDDSRQAAVMDNRQRASFQEALVTACDVTSMEGVELLFPSDLEHGLMMKEADGKAFLIPEGAIRSDKEIRVSMAGSGELEGKKLSQSTKFRSAVPLQSFLLHASPSTRIEEEGSQHFSGRVVFDRPIEAVITSGKWLNATEKLVSESSSSSTDLGRGLEPFHIWEKEARGEGVSDVLRVSEDRKTLSFRLLVGKGLDQVRVLVAAE